MPPHLPPVPSVVAPEELPPATLLRPPLAPPLSGRASGPSSFGRTASPATSRHAATPPPPGAPPPRLLPVRGQRPHLLLARRRRCLLPARGCPSPSGRGGFGLQHLPWAAEVQSTSQSPFKCLI